MNDTIARDLAYLRHLSACADAIGYVKSVGSMERAWRECQRGDWMAWLAGQVVDRRRIVGIASACARLALPAWIARYPADSRVADCLDACDRYAHGEDVDLAPVDATPYAAADAAAYAAYSADAYASFADADRNRIFAQCADIVRERVTWAEIEVEIAKEVVGQ